MVSSAINDQLILIKELLNFWSPLDEEKLAPLVTKRQIYR